MNYKLVRVVSYTSRVTLSLYARYSQVEHKRGGKWRVEGGGPGGQRFTRSKKPTEKKIIIMQYQTEVLITSNNFLPSTSDSFATWAHNNYDQMPVISLKAGEKAVVR